MAQNSAWHKPEVRIFINIYFAKQDTINPFI